MPVVSFPFAQGLRGCAQCKRELGAKVNERFALIREKRLYYENHIDEVKDILNEGSKKACAEAKKIMANVRDLIKMY